MPDRIILQHHMAISPKNVGVIICVLELIEIIIIVLSFYDFQFGSVCLRLINISNQMQNSSSSISCPHSPNGRIIEPELYLLGGDVSPSFDIKPIKCICEPFRIFSIPQIKLHHIYLPSLFTGTNTFLLISVISRLLQSEFFCYAQIPFIYKHFK